MLGRLRDILYFVINHPLLLPHVSSLWTKKKQFGSGYGGWVICPSELKSGLVLSAGVGEDVSFEIDLFDYNRLLEFILVDPTPRSINYINQNFIFVEGVGSECEYSGENGIRFKFVKKALGAALGRTKMYLPINEAHVSGSLYKGQSNVNSDNVIDVAVVDLNSVIRLSDRPVDLLKLDIEGAEIEVLDTLSGCDVLPLQICIEFDILINQELKGKRLVRRAHKQLQSLGYRLMWSDLRNRNVLYVRSERC